jgi:hypothetical protein
VLRGVQRAYHGRTLPILRKPRFPVLDFLADVL